MAMSMQCQSLKTWLEENVRPTRESTPAGGVASRTLPPPDSSANTPTTGGDILMNDVASVFES